MILVVRIIFDNWALLGGAGGLTTPYVELPADIIKMPYYYPMLLVAIGAVYLAYWIRHSKFGLGLRAISQDEVKAEVAGVPTNQYKILAFAISAVFVGIAGALWGSYLTYLKPSIFLTIGIATHMVLMTVLGGKGTVSGSIVGAVVLSPSTNSWWPGWAPQS
jgi:branched-chain amino acid transport system permease protein